MELTYRYFDFIYGIGVDPQGCWLGEPSLLVLGIKKNFALSLGRKFSQNAIVWIGSDCIPSLEVLV